MKLASWTALALAFAIGQAGGGGVPRLETASPRTPTSAARPPLEIEADQTVDLRKLDAIEPLVQAAIAEKKLPGAVVLIGRGDRILYQRAIGSRALVPAVEAMSIDTIFDLASLTKVVATTTSVMMLIERGKLRLNDRVSTFIPGFERYGKADITIRHLLTHMSGLRPDLDLGEAWTGSDTAIALAVEEVPTTPAGQRFVYSDINFFLLGDIVRRVSGQTLDKFAKQEIFDPLGMRDTMFLPSASLRPRIAPTESCLPFAWPCQGAETQMLRGVVHDPTARRMGGVAGHAGLFSTAADLAIFCRMLLAGGVYHGARVLSPLAVEKMTSPTIGDDPNVRGLGWDIDSSYSSNRGELLPVGSFGHTGFTGTSLWIDPATDMFVVFLSNRVHPDGKGDVTPLRARVATVAASAILAAPPAAASATWTGRDFGPSGPRPTAPPREPVMTGLDVLRAQGFAPLQGKRVGLITNHTGRAKDGSAAIDLLHDAKNVKLVALFGPEHGIRGVLDSTVPAETDAKTGLPIHSLYGESRRPTAAMLDGIDTLVIDLQDIGARFYTYMTTMAYAMEEAAKRKIPVVVLDRPNPDRRVPDRRPRAGQGPAQLYWILPDADPARDDTWRARAALQRRKPYRGRPDRRGGQELEAGRLVRRHWPALDQPVAQHAEPQSGDPVSGHWRDRRDQPVGRSRYRHALRTGRRPLDRRRQARRGPERPQSRWGSVLPGPLHSNRRASTPARSARAFSWS